MPTTITTDVTQCLAILADTLGPFSIILLLFTPSSWGTLHAATPALSTGISSLDDTLLLATFSYTLVLTATPRLALRQGSHCKRPPRPDRSHLSVGVL